MLKLVVLIASLWPMPHPALTAVAADALSARPNPAEEAQAKQASKPKEQKPDKAETAKAADGQDKDNAGKQEQGDEEAAKPSPPTPVKLKPVGITLGVSEWNLSKDANENKFRHYGTPPRGPFVQEFLLAPKPSPMTEGYFTARAPGEIDYRYDAGLSTYYGRTRAEASLWRTEFFDATPFIIPESRRQVLEDSFKQFLARDFSFSTRYRMDKEDDYWDAPRDATHQRTRYWDAIGAGKLGQGQIKLEYTNFRYYDRTLTLFDTTVDGITLGYMWNPNVNMGLEGKYSNLDVTQVGAPKGNIQALSLTGDATVFGATDLGFLLRQDRLSLPVVQTAYAREQRIGQISLGQSWGKWNVRFALSDKEIERVRADQSFVDIPQWITGEGRLDGRLARDWRLMVRGYTQTANHLPPMNTLDPRSLYWSSRDFVQTRLQYGKRNVSGYFTWTYRNWDNEARAVNVNLNSYVVGGSWQATPKLSLFAEYTREEWTGKSADDPVFGQYLPDGYVLATGLDYVVSPRAFLSVNVSNFDTNNDNPLLLRDGNTNGIFATISARYLLNGGNEIGIIVAPWTYRDELASQMNYDAALVLVTGKFRF